MRPELLKATTMIAADLVADVLDGARLGKTGFILLTFDPRTDGEVCFVSDGAFDEMLRLMREFIARKGGALTAERELESIAVALENGTTPAVAAEMIRAVIRDFDRPLVKLQAHA